MADYEAIYSDGPNRPIVTHNEHGLAMVFTAYGNLAVAATLTGFIEVHPVDRSRTYRVSGTFGIGEITEA